MNLLITGGTGSLGRALIERYLPSASFGKICMYSRGEHNQELVREQFKDNPDAHKLRFLIGDVRDKDRIKLAVRDIDVIIHAAALKVVPVAEYNPFEALKTNAIGAQNLIDAVIEGRNPHTKVIAVSTDKAVNPINLYGATKLCAEKLFIAANNIRGIMGPRFSVVRYGNVSNSQGSVIPLFRRIIESGGNITITHPDMTRYWITLNEAVRLIDRSLNNMVGGEIFVPDMPAFRVVDLANAMQELYGYENYHIVTGIRPGEKLHETIITKEELEKTLYLKNERMYVINSHYMEIPAVMPKYENLTSENAYRLSLEELKVKLVELKAICPEKMPSMSLETSSQPSQTIPEPRIA